MIGQKGEKVGQVKSQRAQEVHKSGQLCVGSKVFERRCNDEHPVLLLMDNHELHLSLEESIICLNN